MDRTFNQNLMSGVINQVKPFAGIIDTSGQVLEKHTTTVVNNNETLIEQEEVIKRSTFNMTKFNSNLKEGGSKFSDGIKELSGGLVDFGDMFDTIGKKFKAIGDIGRGIASPVTSLFSAFEKDDEEEKKDAETTDAVSEALTGDDGEKPGLDDLVDPTELKKKKKLDVENNKQTKTQNKNLKASAKGFKGMLRGLAMLSIKFLLIVGVVALLVVGMMKLISALSDNGGLQSVFDFISNIMGRVRNAFDAVILGIDSALKKIPGVKGFLDDEAREGIEGRMRDRTAQRAFRKQRADDSSRVEEIRKEKEAEGLKGSELDAAVDRVALEEGLITDRMFLANEEERAAGMKGVMIEGKDGVISAGDKVNQGFLEQAVKETGDAEYREDLLNDLTDDPEKAKNLIADAEARSQQLIQALSYADDKPRIEKKLEIAIKDYDQKLARFGPDHQRTIESLQKVEALVAELSTVQAYLDNFKAVTGDDAGEVIAKMKMGKGSDTFGEGNKKFFNFGMGDFAREFNEYAATKDGLIADIDKDQAAAFGGFKGTVDAYDIRDTSKEIQDMRNMTEEERLAATANQGDYSNIASATNQNITNMMTTITGGDKDTSNGDLQNL